MRHLLYVKLTNNPNKNETIALLEYIRSKLQFLNKMNINIKVVGVSDAQLRIPEFINMLKQQNVAYFPSLVTSRNTYDDIRQIVDLYETNIKKFIAESRPPSNLSDFYAHEMVQKKASESDDDDEAMGKENNMMDSYRHQMDKRNRSDRPTSGGRPMVEAADNAQQPPPRPNNIAINPGDVKLPEEEDDVAPNPQDDIMEKAYYSNRFDSVDGDYDVKNMLSDADF